MWSVISWSTQEARVLFKEGWGRSPEGDHDLLCFYQASEDTRLDPLGAQVCSLSSWTRSSMGSS